VEHGDPADEENQRRQPFRQPALSASPVLSVSQRHERIVGDARLAVACARTHGAPGNPDLGFEAGHTFR
jgi:hypothetical protein